MKSILSFVHIEKAAGTSLIHILRRNYLFRYADVRPLTKERSPILRMEDLATYMRLNPAIECIAGHSIYPGQLDGGSLFDFKHITVLRDPVKRYVSQFAYLYSIGRIPNDFEAFLADDQYRDFQTYKLASSYDSDRAKQMLDSMLQVGVVEEFDAFLVRLTRSLDGKFSPFYKRKNTTKPLIDQAAIVQGYHDRILEQNSNDLVVYDYVVSTVIPRLIEEYGGTYDDDLATFKDRNKDCSLGLGPFVDYAFRKLYYEPVTGFIRKRNGLPYLGSY